MTQEEKQVRWSTKRNHLKNKAIVQLVKLGWSYYEVSQLLTPLFADFDKRNVRKIYLRDKDKYEFLTENEQIELKQEANRLCEHND